MKSLASIQLDSGKSLYPFSSCPSGASSTPNPDVFHPPPAADPYLLPSEWWSLLVDQTGCLLYPVW
ncbi:MAG: hypothetical protein ACK5LM_07970 [Lactovum sp.]